MPVLPKNLAAIHNVVASILRSSEHVGMLYSAGNIAAMLRIAADADNNSDIGIDLNSNLVVRAFIFGQKSEYILSYSDYFEHEGDGYLLCVSSYTINIITLS